MKTNKCYKTQCTKAIYSLTLSLLLWSHTVSECNAAVQEDHPLNADVLSTDRQVVRNTSAFEAVVNRLSANMDDFCKSEVKHVLRNIASDRLLYFEAMVDHFSVGMDGYDKSEIIYLLGNILPERLTPTFVDMVDRLSETDKSYRGRGLVILQLGKIAPERLTPNFEHTIQHLSLGLGVYYKSRIIEALREAKSEQYFADVVERLFAGHDKHYIIRALEKVPSDRLTLAFADVADRLSAGMDGFGKESVIEALGKVPPEKLTPAFEDMVNDFSDTFNKKHVIVAVGNIAPERLTPAFKDIVGYIISEIWNYTPDDMIESLGTVSPERLTPAFKDVVGKLVDGCSGEIEPTIEALGKVPPEKLTPAFVDMGKRLFEDTKNKSEVIQVLENIEPSRLTTISAELTDGIVDRLNKVLSYKERVSLLRRLSDKETTQERYTEIMRAMDNAQQEEIQVVSEVEVVASRLSIGMNSHSKSEVIKTLKKISTAQLDVFESAVNRFSTGMDPYCKNEVIKALGKTSLDRLTPDFELMVKRLSDGMDNVKGLFILALGKMDIRDLTGIAANTEFADDMVRELRQLVLSNEEVNLLGEGINLWEMNSKISKVLCDFTALNLP